MSDGRHVTDYRPSCDVHDLIRRQNNIKNSYDLKLLMTNNALKIQDLERIHYSKKNACQSCEFYLPDPNQHVAYWDQYNRQIGYNSS